MIMQYKNKQQTEENLLVSSVNDRTLHGHIIDELSKWHIKELALHVNNSIVEEFINMNFSDVNMHLFDPEPIS